MNVEQLRKLYEVNGIPENYLRNVDDLIKVLGIDPKEVSGYDELSPENKALFEKFILKFANQQGLHIQAEFNVKGIYVARDIDYALEYNGEYHTMKVKIMVADREGNWHLHHEWSEEEEIERLKVDMSKLKEFEGKPYMRFEYQHGDRNEWQHVYPDLTWG